MVEMQKAIITIYAEGNRDEREAKLNKTALAIVQSQNQIKQGLEKV